MTSDEACLRARRTLAAVIAYLNLLDEEWDAMPEGERHLAVRLALEAAKRPIGERDSLR